jgi:hypothetical protein
MSTTPSDQKPREVKSAQYKHPGYETELAMKGSFMDDDNEGANAESKDLCRKNYLRKNRMFLKLRGFPIRFSSQPAEEYETGMKPKFLIRFLA